VRHFSVSPSPRLALETYIANQAQHHRKVSFQDEYPRLLKKYSVQFDERYVWNWIGCGFFRALKLFRLGSRGVAPGTHVGLSALFANHILK
jgi:hypothetical protein